MKWNPEGDSTITMKVYPMQAGTASGTTGTGFFDLVNGAATPDITQPLRVSNSHYRDKYRILILQTNDPTVSTAQAATTNTFSAQRLGMTECYFTKCTPSSLIEGNWEVTAVCGPYDKANSSNIMVESCTGTGTTDILPAIAAYTTSNKFG